MELEILKKKISSFRGEGGRIRKVSDELLLEILSTWENWTGSSKEFYTGIGSSQTGISSLLGKAKRLKREGGVATLASSSEFEEIKIDGITNTQSSAPIICDIEVQDRDRIIRFRKVDLLVEYLKKVS